ncbi:hypothetical protein EW145_g3797 [Phellinidium pouzarii]|uniref:Reverse transcriptase Ty1/copia-type domain-containing protein n=1 Tax=Phellinidium pouzarii TaxID=167371 RepID=A0A4S4L616_9AGAM|nr:hypothetical protein EW145_g3797 [Phellinidium pouzarii]
MRLRKPLYSLKQSGQKWYQKITWILVDQIGFTCCDVNQGAFFRHDAEKLIVIVIHVDDCTIAATTTAQINEFKSALKKHVDITDLGPAHWLLGLEIKCNCNAKTIALSQTAYINSILCRFNLQDLKLVSTPMEVNMQLHSSQAPQTTEETAEMCNVPYHEAVGSLMYAGLATRLDIAFAITLLSRFSSNPGPAHWNTVKRIFWYLNGTKSLWLTYGGVENGFLKGYGDADGSMQEDRHAISGNAFLIDGGVVSWFSK